MNTPTVNNNRIAFVQSCWHKDIVEQGKTGLIDKLAKHGLADIGIDCFELPGALEIPLKCKELSKLKKYKFIVAAGFVVDGGIYKHEFVAQAVLTGLMDVQLQHEVPILSMVLTPKDYEDSTERNKFFYDHFLIKGAEIADSIKMLMS